MDGETVFAAVLRSRNHRAEWRKNLAMGDDLQLILGWKPASSERLPHVFFLALKNAES